MADAYHDLFLEYGDTLSKTNISQLPIILVVGREPNNPNPFKPTIGKYPLKAQKNSNGRRQTVAFWDQAYGVVGKTADMSCSALKSVARSANVSPIIFTDVMPIPAAYSPESNAPNQAREAATENSILAHHEEIFTMQEIMGRVTVVILAGHRHGNFTKRERTMLEFATSSFNKLCAQQARPIETISTKSMFGNNQPWNLEAIKSNSTVEKLIQDAVNSLLEFDEINSSKAA